MYRMYKQQQQQTGHGLETQTMFKTAFVK